MGQPRQAQELEPVTPSGGDDEQLLELSARACAPWMTKSGARLQRVLRTQPETVITSVPFHLPS